MDSTVDQSEIFDFFISDILKILKVFGVDIWSADWRLSKLTRLILPIILAFLYASVFAIFFLIFCQSNTSVVLESLFVSGGTEMFLIKLATTIWHRKNITQLMDKIRNEFWKFTDGDDLKKKILIEGSRKMKIYVRVFVGLFMLTTSVCEIRPIIAVIFFGKFEAPLLVTMPGDMTFQ